MRTIKHPLSGALYDLTDDGLICVTSRSGATGLFDAEGRWQSGELRQADPHVCVWIGGAQLDHPYLQTSDAGDAGT